MTLSLEANKLFGNIVMRYKFHFHKVTNHGMWHTSWYVEIVLFEWFFRRDPNYYDRSPGRDHQSLTFLKLQHYMKYFLRISQRINCVMWSHCKKCFAVHREFCISVGPDVFLYIRIEVKHRNNMSWWTTFVKPYRPINILI